MKNTSGPKPTALIDRDAAYFERDAVVWRLRPKRLGSHKSVASDRYSMAPSRHQIADWPETPDWVQRALDNVLAGGSRITLSQIPPRGRLLREGFTFVRPLFQCFRASRLLRREDFLALFLACDTLCEHGCGPELHICVSAAIADAMQKCVRGTAAAEDDRAIALELGLRWRQLAPWVGVWAAACHSLDSKLGEGILPPPSFSQASGASTWPVSRTANPPTSNANSGPPMLHVARVAHEAFGVALARTLPLARLEALGAIYIYKYIYI